jgi:hypothetical protein
MSADDPGKLTRAASHTAHRGGRNRKDCCATPPADAFTFDDLSAALSPVAPKPAPKKRGPPIGSRGYLAFGKGKPNTVRDPGQRLVGIDPRPGQRAIREPQQLGDGALGSV